MAFEDLKDQLSDRAQALWSRLQESSTFVQAMEQYQSQPPATQKAIVAAIGATLAVVLFLIPYSFYSSSQEKVLEFEDNKALIENVFEVRRDAGLLRIAPPKMDENQIINMAQSRVSASGIPAERVKVEAYDNKNTGRASAVIPKTVEQRGAAVRVGKLNLTQMVEIGYALQTISSGVKMVAMDARAAADDPRYYDVTYKIVDFNMPEAPAPAKDTKGAKPGRKSSRERSEDGDQ